MKVPDGWKVQIQYFRTSKDHADGDEPRRYYRSKTNYFAPGEKGGYTVVFMYQPITDARGNAMSTAGVTGFSECSKHDQFEYKVGRELAYSRAIAHMKKLGLA